MRFAFLVHPLTPNMVRIFGLRAGLLPLALGGREALRREGLAPSNIRIITELPSIISATGARCEGRIIGIPALPELLLSEQEAAVRLMATAAMQYGVGCELVGLGALCAIVGSRGEALAARLPKPVTTGNSLTCWASAETVTRLWERLSGSPRFVPRVLLVGFPGTMAEGLLQVLARRGLPVEVYHPSLPKRQERQLAALEAELQITIPRWSDLDAALERRGIVVGAGSLGGELAEATLRPGTVVVDVAQPLDTTPAQRAREDLLVVEGELVTLPEATGAAWRSLFTGLYNHIVGQGDARVFACLAEPMVLALEGRAEPWSLGRTLDPQRVEALGALASRHGFAVRDLYTGTRLLDEERLMRFVQIPWLVTPPGA